MAWVPGEELLKRVWESIDKLGIGILSPAQIRRTGKAKADVRRLEMLNEATALQEVADIASGKARLDSKGMLVYAASREATSPKLIAGSVGRDLEEQSAADISLHSSDNFASRAEAAHIVRQARASAALKEVGYLHNLRETVRVAEEELEGTPEPFDADNRPEVDFDWLNSWREGAERTSSEQIRRLWARLLIEETKKTGSFSLRTLTFIRSLDPSDAKLIEKIAPYVMGDASIVQIDNGRIAEIGFDELLALEDIGVLSGVTSLGLSNEAEYKAGGKQLLDFHGNIGIFYKTQDARKFTLPIIAVTKIGVEVIRLGRFTTPEHYLVKISKLIEDQGFEVKRVRYERLPNGDRQLFGV